MNYRIKMSILGLLTLMAIVSMAMLKPIPQDPSYHLFIDHRTLAGIPNFWNVISNIPFAIIGTYGLFLLRTPGDSNVLNGIYAVLFSGILLTAFGSAYYHYNPDNDSLVYDRIPMTIVFMSFLCVTISECINIKAGKILLAPLLLAGIASVLWWQYTESLGTGDLRFYGLIQFYPVILVPLIFLFFRSSLYNKGLTSLTWVIVWYLIAKLCEVFDKDIYSITGFISGHTLKHVAAALSAWFIVRMYSKKYILNTRYSPIS